MTWETVLQQLLATGITLAGAWAFVNTKLDKWLDNRFEKKLQALQFEHEKNLEAVRHRIQSEFSRVSKIHEKEFEVFPKLWLMLHEAHGYAFNAVGLRMVSGANWSAMSEEAVREQMTKIGFSEIQIKKLLSLDDDKAKQDYYFETVQGNNIDNALNKQRLLMNCICENRIFLTPELDTLFTDATKSIGVALECYVIGKRAGDWDMQRENMDSIKRLEGTLPDIARLIQARLCHDAAGVRLLSETTG